MKTIRLISAFLLVIAAVGAIGLFILEKKEQQRMLRSSSLDINKYIEDHAPKPGMKAIDFTLPVWGGGSKELYRNGGKPTVINFWATYCDYCEEEMGTFQKLYEQMGDRVNFLMINATYTEHLEAVDRMVKKNHWTFPVLLDQHGTVGNAYFAKAFPQTFIITADHRILFHHSGTNADGTNGKGMEGRLK
jgi:peroxiredoxin